MKRILFLSVFLVCFSAYAQKFGQLAQTPPMGWNSWNKFGCDVNEQMIKEMADAMVSSGMKDAGYEYIVIDDCWQIGRDSLGNIIADPERFPSGMKALADYVHSKGLKFGLYSDAGRYTCQARPGSRGYEYQDARTYASWGVDYLKYDWCNHGKQNSEASYKLMRDALYKAGRPIVFSICEWGSTKPWEWAGDIGHLWRTTYDIQDCWDCLNDWGGMGWTLILDKQEGLEEYAGPGKWNDPDMLEVGNGGMTIKEYKAHFALWCMLAAPLMAGNDLRDMSKGIRDILTAKEVITINQDPLGKQGYKYKDHGDLEIWLKPLSNEEMAVCLFNRGDDPQNIIMHWTWLIKNCENKYSIRLYDGNYILRDLWKGKDLGAASEINTIDIPARDVLLLRLKKDK